MQKAYFQVDIFQEGFSRRHFYEVPFDFDNLQIAAMTIFLNMV